MVHGVLLLKKHCWGVQIQMPCVQVIEHPLHLHSIYSTYIIEGSWILLDTIQTDHEWTLLWLAPNTTICIPDKVILDLILTPSLICPQVISQPTPRGPDDGGDEGDSSSSPIAVIVGVVVGVAFLLVVLVVGVLCLGQVWYKKHRSVRVNVSCSLGVNVSRSLGVNVSRSL